MLNLANYISYCILYVNRNKLDSIARTDILILPYNCYIIYIFVHFYQYYYIYLTQSLNNVKN